MASIANVLSDKGITFRRKSENFSYKATNIVRIEKVGRYLSFYYRCPIENKVKLENYYFEFSLKRFLKQHGLEMYLKQAHRNWLVNPSYIKYVDKSTMHIVFFNGETVPTSKLYVNNFLYTTSDKVAAEKDVREEK